MTELESRPGCPESVPEHVWDAVLDVATIQQCYEAAREGTGWDVATLVGQAVEAAVTAMAGARASKAITVELPEPSGSDETGIWWNYAHGSGVLIAGPVNTAEHARYMRQKAAALLAAAVHIENALAPEPGQPDAAQSRGPLVEANALIGQLIASWRTASVEIGERIQRVADEFKAAEARRRGQS
jgi:hypothetical protein